MLHACVSVEHGTPSNRTHPNLSYMPDGSLVANTSLTILFLPSGRKAT